MSSSASGSSTGFLGSPGFKFFLIGFLILLLQVPLLMVWGLSKERSRNAQQVQRGIASSWGGAQNISGPFLIVPYTKQVITRRGEKEIINEVRSNAIFLPRSLMVEGDAKTSVRSRSIYDVTVYASKLRLSGSFDAPDLRKIAPDALRVEWKNAYVALGISDVAGMVRGTRLMLDGQDANGIPFEPSAGPTVRGVNGIHAPLFSPDSPGDKPVPGFQYALELDLKGSQELKIAPSGKQTDFSLASDWPHPSFSGRFLPVKREISEKGFSAQWRVPDLARSVPQAWTGNDLNRLRNYAYGVRFYTPIDFYDLVERSMKYGLMFLVVAFMIVFLMEMLSDKKVHMVQYLFVGVAMVFFYVLLLSIAEHIGFLASYIISALATGLMLSVYVAKVTDSPRRGVIMWAAFVLMYAFLYMILQMEDYALLVGAITGFVLLTATMFLTLRIDWSGGGKKMVATE